MDFTTNDWVFNLGGEKPKMKDDDKELVSLIGESDRWTQYQNELVYELDSLIREWIETNSKNWNWVKSYRLRKYTMKMVFEQIYGKPYTDKEMKKTYWFSKILRYYSTKVSKGGTISGRNYSKTVYTISPNRVKKPPFSLKLRLEWFAQQGIMPTYKNMALPKDKLKVGHARNPKTEKNMQERRERAKARYNERYNKRDH